VDRAVHFLGTVLGRPVHGAGQDGPAGDNVDSARGRLHTLSPPRKGAAAGFARDIPAMHTAY